jgi:RNA polymerase sigma factor (sigma-70 family)
MPVTSEDLRFVETVVSRFAGGKNYSYRDDIVSDGMFALAEAVNLWDESPAIREQFPTRAQFLRLVIKRRSIDGIRQRTGRNKDGRNLRREFEDSMLRLDKEIEDGNESILGRFAGEEEDALGEVVVDELLAQLPDREREVVRRSVLEGETEASIARDFGVSEARVSQIRVRALNRLRGEATTPTRWRPDVRTLSDPALRRRPDFGLSDREREILAGMADGRLNRELASSLIISEETIKSHVRSILSKMRARSRTHAVALALREGVIT